MELKLLLFTFLVVLATFGNVESKRTSSGGSRSRGSSHTSHSSYKPSVSHYTPPVSHYKPPVSHYNPPVSHYNPPVHKQTITPVQNHGGSSSFLNGERGSGSSGNSYNKSPFSPFAPVPKPPVTSGNNNNKSPFSPFAPVPKPPVNSGNSNNQSPFSPFAPIPKPSVNTGHVTNSNNRPPYPSFPPVPTHTGFPKPSAPVIGNGQGTPTRPFVPVPPVHNGNVYPRPGINSGRTNHSMGFLPPSPGFNVGPPVHQPTQGSHLPTGHNTQPTTTYPRQPPYNPSFNRPGNISHYQPPITPSVIHGTNSGNPYPRQPPYNPSFGQPGNIPYPQPPVVHGTNSGISYPRQPAYNPSFGHPTGNYYPMQPGHTGTHFIQPNPTHIYHQPVMSLPPNPSHTVVVVPGQSGYHRGTGDIFKEAIIHAGVNAAVNRITSPHYHSSSWNHNSWSNYPPQTGSSVTTTHVVTNNYYDQTGGGGVGLPNNGAGGSNLPPNYPAQTYPNGGQSGYPQNQLPSRVVNPGLNTGNLANPVYPGNSGPQSPTNGQSYPNQNNGNGQSNTGFDLSGWIPDEELRTISEKLFNMDENNAYQFITLNLQHQTSNNTNLTDESPQPLFNVQSAAYEIPTIRAIRSLYQTADEIKKKTRQNSRKEEALLVDLLLNTNVMTAAMEFLAKKKLINSDYLEHKDALKKIWFTPYDGTSSGFKRVFQGEAIGGEVLYGIQDWVALDFQEKTNGANYLSYVQEIKLGRIPKASLLKLNFELNGIVKAGTSIFVGTSPELEMALYTICHYTRPDNYCPISLGGTQLMLYTHTFRYFGNDLIDMGFPIII